MIKQLVKTTVLSIAILTTMVFAKDFDLKGSGVALNYLDEFDAKKTTIIKRNHNPICNDKKKVNGANPDTIWGGEYANVSVPSACKKTYVTTIGKISPIKIAEGIDTYGELEVIEYMKKAQTDENLLLVDARMANWYAKSTIPSAKNIPFKSFDPKHADFEIVMDAANVEYDEGVYDYSEAKTMVLFCNGTWCPQSTWAIENLLKIGYPKEKLKWYRGGMYSWTSLNLTTIVPNQ